MAILQNSHVWLTRMCGSSHMFLVKGKANIAFMSLTVQHTYSPAAYGILHSVGKSVAQMQAASHVRWRDNHDELSLWIVFIKVSL